MYKLAIFDLDGTLLNTIGDLAAAGNYTLKKLSLPVHSEEKYRRFVGNGIPKLIERMLFPVTEEKITAQALEIFMEYYSEHKSDLTRPYPGIEELIKSLNEQGIICAANTNKAQQPAEALLSHFFGEGISRVMGYGDFPPKPDPSAALELMKLYNIPKEQAIYIGDSDVDIITGHNAGIKVCAVLWGFRDYEELAAQKPEFFARNSDELHKILCEN